MRHFNASGVLAILLATCQWSFAAPFHHTNSEDIFNPSHNFITGERQDEAAPVPFGPLARETTGERTNAFPNGFSRPGFKPTGAAHQFIFFAVLEGLYEDGVSREDTSRILHREDGQNYTHFIYQCPLCESVLQAVEVYAARPHWRYKAVRPPLTEATFGPGLDAKTKEGLASDDVKIRLATIYELVSRWVNLRLTRTPISEEEKVSLQAELELGKEAGLRALTNYKKDPTGNSIRANAPGFADLDECAMCSGVTHSSFQGMVPTDLHAPKPSPLRKKF